MTRTETSEALRLLDQAHGALIELRTLLIRAGHPGAAQDVREALKTLRPIGAKLEDLNYSGDVHDPSQRS